MSYSLAWLTTRSPGICARSVASRSANVRVVAPVSAPLGSWIHPTATMCGVSMCDVGWPRRGRIVSRIVCPVYRQLRNCGNRCFRALSHGFDQGLSLRRRLGRELDCKRLGEFCVSPQCTRPITLTVQQPHEPLQRSLIVWIEPARVPRPVCGLACGLTCGTTTRSLVSEDPR